MQRAMATAISMQSVSYLTDLLIGKGCKVQSTVRSASSSTTDQVGQIDEESHEPGSRREFRHGDKNDSSALVNLIRATARSTVEVQQKSVDRISFAGLPGESPDRFLRLLNRIVADAVIPPGRIV
jgi:GDP-D-mannose dehydratase